MIYKKYLEKLYRPPLEKNNRQDYICLDKNEAPFSAFELVDGLISDEDITSLKAYPDPYYLYEQLASFVGVSIHNLLITHGSEQSLRYVFDTFLESEDEVIYPNPSFAMFDVFSYYNNANIKHLEYNENRELTVETIINAITTKTKLFVLANPNNPTGTSFDLDELKTIAEHTLSTDTIFLLDEAYFHYYNIDSISLIKEYSNLIITRTFSKAWGLAGIRVGYAISNDNNISLLRKQKPMDEINQLSLSICLSALEHSYTILDKNTSQVIKWKKLFKYANYNGIKYLETEGNFILLKFENYTYYKEILLKNKILPKIDFSNISVKDCIRISISNDTIMQTILDIFTNNKYRLNS